jgi:hypothetical protein
MAGLTITQRQDLGAEFRSWDDESVDWRRYDRVVLRSVWN